MGSRCTGHCCQIFYLGPVDELRTELTRKSVDPSYPVKDQQEFKTILDMIIPYQGCSREEDAKWDLDWQPERQPTFGYTCRHYDGNNCTIYDSRPEMCRVYPNYRPCRHVGCTYDGELSRPREGDLISEPIPKDEPLIDVSLLVREK